jgi:5-formyltetrahydrofolate cyclo-ligase
MTTESKEMADNPPWPDVALIGDKAAARSAARNHARNAVLEQAPVKDPEAPVNRLLDLMWPSQDGRWAIYRPMKAEAPLGALLEPQALPLVAYVRTHLDHSLLFVGWDGETDLTPDALGMDAPPLACGVVPDEEIDVVLTPGLAFGPRGQRLGRGKGCYDRTLKRVDHALRVAVTWERCLFCAVPTGDLDEPVDLIVTEARLHWTGARGFTAPGVAATARGRPPRGR